MHKLVCYKLNIDGQISRAAIVSLNQIVLEPPEVTVSGARERALEMGYKLELSNYL